MSDLDAALADAAERAVADLADGMVVGLGTGSAATAAVRAIGRRVREGLRIAGVPTSARTEALARELGIPLAALGEDTLLDVAIDGADEVERAGLALLKGRGGALLREKLVASASRRLVILIDPSKWVDCLGSRHPVPVEVVPFGWPATAARLRRLGATPELRLEEGEPFVTDGGHHILDCRFPPIADPAALAREIDAVVGVVEHGLFVGFSPRVIEAPAA
ncbi:MAG TPA: ribose-5-phosphate isomerase RpiA [Haliangiales bacterium]|nr:ribose-5-phosphate isomerase RpiA [Haliangiales bacterium]